MKNWLTISEEVTGIRIMTSKLIIIFEGGDALEVSRLPQLSKRDVHFSIASAKVLVFFEPAKFFGTFF